MNYHLQTDFETFWKSFDPDHQFDRETKKFIEYLFDAVRRINFEAPQVYDPDRDHLRKRLGQSR